MRAALESFPYSSLHGGYKITKAAALRAPRFTAITFTFGESMQEVFSPQDTASNHCIRRTPQTQEPVGRVAQEAGDGVIRCHGHASAAGLPQQNTSCCKR
jgi:hypothetical protein